MIPYFFFIFYTVLTVKYFYLNLPKQKCCCNMVTFKFSHWTLTSTVFHIPIVTLLKKNLLIVTIFVFINKLLYSAPRIFYFSCWIHIKCLLLRMYCLPYWSSLEIKHKDTINNNVLSVSICSLLIYIFILGLNGKIATCKCVFAALRLFRLEFTWISSFTTVNKSAVSYVSDKVHINYTL